MISRRINQLVLTLVFLQFLLVSQAISANLIYKQDFEQPGLRLSDVFYTSGPSPEAYVSIVTSNCHSGTRCIRGNVYEGATDPITGLPGENSPRLNIGGVSGTPEWGTYHNFRDHHVQELYVSFWMRWDQGANFQRDLGYGAEPGAYKIMYVSSTGNINQSYTNRYVNSFSFYQNSGMRETYVQSPNGNINDGRWHHYEIYLKYETSYGAGNGIWRVWEDGKLVWDRNNITFLTSSDGKFTSIRFIHYTGGALASSGWQIDDIEIWDGIPDSEGSGGESDANDTSPGIQITSPTSENSFVSDAQTVTISGSADDDNGINSIVWANNRGGSGNATNDSGDWTLWSVANIPLQEGENVITVTVSDTRGQTATDTITVTYSHDGTQVWSANEQTADSSWEDSQSTLCARVLIEGTCITQAGNQIMLGFQGRSSGEYRIRKVSIAEKDTNGGEGDVVDSTWTKVTFDGNSENTWATDVTTVPSGSMKLSNPVSFNIQPGKDYYVTYLLESPSVYLIPPSYYQELYFKGADHSEDIDWSSNGHSSYARLHAIAAIYVTSAGSNPDTTPPGDVTNAGWTAGPGKITLSWTNPTDSDFAGVMIRFRTDGTHPQTPSDGQPIPNGNNGRMTGNPGESMTYEHCNLDPNLHYYYSIFTYDTSGNFSHTVFLDAQPLPLNTGNEPPTASISASPASGESPLTVSFSGMGSDSDGTIQSYSWDFGDGATSTSQNPTHTYARVSSETQYTVTLTVTDDDGATGQATTTITVSPDSTPPMAPQNVTVE